MWVSWRWRATYQWCGVSDYVRMHSPTREGGSTVCANRVIYKATIIDQTNNWFIANFHKKKLAIAAAEAPQEREMSTHPDP